MRQRGLERTTIGPIRAIGQALRNYLDFKGRARRAEYWWFAAFVFVGGYAIGTLSSLAYVVFTLAMILPLVSVSARRLHDVGYSAWWLLVFVVPNLAIGLVISSESGSANVSRAFTEYQIVALMSAQLAGLIWLASIFLTVSQTIENAYGPSPVHSPRRRL